MSANVFFVIIPNQKRVVADLIAGRHADPALGKQARQRSLHNNYLTLPVVLTMISSHYPMLFEQPYAWLFVAALFVGGGLVRHYYNLKDAGRSGNWVDWLLVYAAGIAVALVIVSMDLSNRGTNAATGGRRRQLAEVVTIIQNRCVACHSATPSDGSFTGAAEGHRLRHAGGDRALRRRDPARGRDDPGDAARQPHGDDAGGARARRSLGRRRRLLSLIRQ